MVKDFKEWFDIFNPEHLKAYRNLRETGIWPVDFWEVIKTERVNLGSGWQIWATERYIQWLETQLVLCLTYF